jgi:hypothetical protein
MKKFGFQHKGLGAYSNGRSTWRMPRTLVLWESHTAKQAPNSVKHRNRIAS